MFLSLCYVALRWVLQVAALRLRSSDFKDLEIVVLRHQRIAGELKGLGMAVSATTVRTWLREEGLGPAGTRRRDVLA